MNSTLSYDIIAQVKPGTHHATFVFCWTQRRRKDENRMVYAHQRRSSFVDFTNATVVGPIRKSNRSNNCRMVCAGRVRVRVRHPSLQPTDHRPITVQNFRDAWLTQIGDPLSVKMAKVDAEHKTWARPATGYGGALLGKTACSTGYGVIIIGLLK